MNTEPMQQDSSEGGDSFAVDRSIDVKGLVGMLKTDESITSLMPEGDPKIDIKRLVKIFKDKPSFVAGVTACLSTRDKKQDGHYRSAKNLVLVIAYLKMSSRSQKDLSVWVKENQDKDVKDRSKVQIGGLSAGTCQNYLNYLDSERWEMNKNYLTNFFAKVYRKEMIIAVRTSSSLTTAASKDKDTEEGNKSEEEEDKKGDH
jgi:hypothetical protein